MANNDNCIYLNISFVLDFSQLPRPNGWKIV